MDPLHITEFASDRYFTKFNQQQQQQQQQELPTGQAFGSGSSTTTSTVPFAFPQSSPFILPLRESKAAHELEGKDKDAAASRLKHKKSRFHLKSLIHSKHAHPIPVPVTSPIPTPIPVDLSAAVPEVSPVAKP